MKKIFSFRLYGEGLKILRLPGFTTGIIITLLMCADPIIKRFEFGEPCACGRPHMYILTMSQFALPLLLLLIVAPFFIFRVFAFLNKRNSSDFFHSIPYRRTCVLLSFLAAIYTWVIGIMILALGSSVFFWKLAYAKIEWELVLSTFALLATAAIFIGGFALLAKTLTGNSFSGGILALVMLSAFRVIGWIVVDFLQEAVPLADLNYSIFRIFSVKTSILAVIYQGFTEKTSLASPLMWIFTAIVILITYSLSIIFYARRRSETAEKNAFGRWLQHFYSCGFSLPFALLATVALMKGDNENHIAEVLIWGLISVAVFLLCELISYKKIKSALKKTPLLLIVFAMCGAFAGVAVLYENHVYSTVYQREEIASISFYNYDDLLSAEVQQQDYVHSWLSTASYSSHNYDIKDQTVIERIVQAWEATAKGKKENDRMCAFLYVKINLKNGTTVGRQIGFTQEQFQELLAVIKESEEYQFVTMQLPSQESIRSIYTLGINDPEMEMMIWECFKEEYNALPPESKAAYAKEQQANKAKLEASFMFADELFIELDYQDYSSERFDVTDRFPKTREMLIEQIKKNYQRLVDKCGNLFDLSNEDIADATGDTLYDFRMKLFYNSIYVPLSWETEEFLSDGAQEALIKEKMDVFRKLFSEGKLFEHNPEAQGFLHLWIKEDSNDSETGTFPFWFNGMDDELFRRIVKLSNPNSMSIDQLNPYSASCIYRLSRDPLQIAFFLPDGKLYSLSAKNEEEFKLLESAMLRIYPCLTASVENSETISENCVEIYIANGKKRFYGTLEVNDLFAILKELTPAT